MVEQILQFFDRCPDAIPLYEKIEKCVKKLVPEVRIKVQKTQISFTTDICLPVFLLRE